MKKFFIRTVKPLVMKFQMFLEPYFKSVNLIEDFIICFLLI
jgi:hypothetical protein